MRLPAKVKAEINQRLKAATKCLGNLGPKRETLAEQSQFMTKIALDFQHLASLAERSEYSHSDLFDEHTKLRLATAAINRGENFAERMATSGHSFEFNSEEKIDKAMEVPNEIDQEDLNREGEYKSFGARTEQDHPDIVDLVHQNLPLSPAYGRGILPWLKKMHFESRGFELGTFKASLLGSAMKKQSLKWSSLAFGYISDIITLVHRMVTDLLKEVTPDGKMRVAIESLLIGELRRRYKEAISLTQFLLQVELEGNPATHNHYFNDTLEKWCVWSLLHQLWRIFYDAYYSR